MTDTGGVADLERFVVAQDGVYERALAEIEAGDKRSHWMWFIFPQLRGLGRSSTARLYGLAGAAEARAYLAHATLGSRLRECTQLVLAVDHHDPHRIFGSPDDLKFGSSMTLFDAVAPDDLFARAIDRFYAGARDRLTLDLLAREGPTS